MVQIEGIVEYTTGQLERLAEEVFRKRPAIDPEPPVNVELLVEYEGDIRIDEMPGLLVNHSVEGCVCKEIGTRNLVVYVDSNLMNGAWPRYYAILGEEFAHIHLHMQLVHQVTSVEDFVEIQQCPQWHRIEQDAKSFSRAIRIPAAQLVAAAEATYPRIMLDQAFGDSGMIEVLMRNALAEQFRVPPDDMRRRLFSIPDSLRERIVASVQLQSPVLVSVDWHAEVRRQYQRQFLDE